MYWIYWSINWFYKFDAISESLEMIKETTKETRSYFGKIGLQLIQIIKEATKVAQKIQTNSDAMFAFSTILFENLRTAIVNTLIYFLHHHGWIFFVLTLMGWSLFCLYELLVCVLSYLLCLLYCLVIFLLVVVFFFANVKGGEKKRLTTSWGVCKVN